MYLCLSDIRQVAAPCSELRYFSIAYNQYGLSMLCSDCLSCVDTGLCVSKACKSRSENTQQLPVVSAKINQLNSDRG